MKWVVECIQKVDFSYVVDLDPKDFLYCADEIELLDEVEDKLYDRMPFFDKVSNDYTDSIKYYGSENVGDRITRNYDFVKKWRELKNQSKKEKE